MIVKGSGRDGGCLGQDGVWGLVGLGVAGWGWIRGWDGHGYHKGIKTDSGRIFGFGRIGG